MSMTGSCLCGQVRYAIEDFAPHAAHCHCAMCRKFHGAAYATYGAVTRDHFTWLAGQDLVHYYRAPNATVRGFCSVCGSSLSFHTGDEAEPARFHVAFGTLDDAPSRLPDAHIHIASKASWSCIGDALPRFDGERTDAAPDLPGEPDGSR